MTARALYTSGQRFMVQGEGYDTDGHIELGDDTETIILQPVLTAFTLSNDSPRNNHCLLELIESGP